MPYTLDVPFENSTVLTFHFEKHKNEFAFADAQEYQAAADAFMGNPLKQPTRECYRQNGDRVRYNRTSGNFAVEAPSGFLKTFHRPSDKYRDRAYFDWECGRTL